MALLTGLILLQTLNAETVFAASDGVRRDTQNEMRRDRSAARKLLAQPAPPVGLEEEIVVTSAKQEPEFKLIATLNYSWTDNGAKTNTNKIDEWYIEPTLELDWTRRFETSALATYVILDSERHPSATTSDGDTLIGSFHWFPMGDTKQNEKISFYVGYEPTLSLTPTFKSQSEFDHDFVAGFETPDATLGKGFTFSAIGFLGYRLADPVTSRAVRATITGAIARDFGDKWSALLKQKIVAVWYVHADPLITTPQTTRALRPVTTLEIDYLPFGKLGPTLAFVTQFTRNAANQAADNFSQWVLTPNIAFSWKF